METPILLSHDTTNSDMNGTKMVIAMQNISGWWFSHPSEKYESQLGWLFPIYGKIKNGNQTTNQIYMGNIDWSITLQFLSPFSMVALR